MMQAMRLESLGILFLTLAGRPILCVLDILLLFVCHCKISSYLVLNKSTVLIADVCEQSSSFCHLI